MSRDFIYVDDTAEATVRLLDTPREPKSTTDPVDWSAVGPDTSWAPFEVVNLGRSDPVSVNELLATLESITGRRAQRNELGMQPGDVERTFSFTRQADPDDRCLPAGCARRRPARSLSEYRLAPKFDEPIPNSEAVFDELFARAWPQRLCRAVISVNTDRLLAFVDWFRVYHRIG